MINIRSFISQQKALETAGQFSNIIEEAFKAGFGIVKHAVDGIFQTSKSGNTQVVFRNKKNREEVIFIRVSEAATELIAAGSDARTLPVYVAKFIPNGETAERQMLVVGKPAGSNWEDATVDDIAKAFGSPEPVGG